MNANAPSKSDTADPFHSEEDALLYLQACIDKDDGDGKLILAALGDVARTRNLGDLAGNASVVRDALSKAMVARNQKP